MQLGTAFWASKTLLSAVELGLFSELASSGPLDAEALRERLGLHPRSARDFFDALVALGMLERDNGLYRNTAETDLFLDRAKPSYIGGLLEMLNARLFGFWNSLTEGLRTGEPQNEAKTGGNLFEAIYSDPERAARIRQGDDRHQRRDRAGDRRDVSLGPLQDRDRHRLRGGLRPGSGRARARAHERRRLRPAGGRAALQRVRRRGGAERPAGLLPGDFFAEDLPSADVLVMGQILHDWDMDEKRLLLEKAYKALPDGGALIVYEAIIDDERRENAFGLLMSLNMLIETRGGFDYTGADCQGWMRDTGFSETDVQHLVGPTRWWSGSSRSHRLCSAGLKFDKAAVGG